MKPKELDQDYITLEFNTETTVTESVDFDATVDDFEDEIRERVNSSGERDRFIENMAHLASLVTAGHVDVKWITCEAEYSRIDLRFEPGSVVCTVHEDVVEDDDD